MEKQKLWELMRSLSNYLMSKYETPMEDAAASVGLNPSECFSVILPAYMFEPDPISAERLRKRSPYNSLQYYQEPLLSVYRTGYLDATPEGGYRLNSKGHSTFNVVMNSAYHALECIALFPQDELIEMKTILAKLVQASILSSDQLNKWSILHSRRLDPGHEVAPLILIDQYISDLSAYRDDAHMASWASYTNNALEWDIFSLLWRSSGISVSEINSKTHRRGWTEQETLEAIEVLKTNGWIEGFSLSHKGISIREKAERMTNQYFFSPWDRLSNEEYQLLCQLFIQFQKITQ